LEVEARADRAAIRRDSLTRLMFSPELSQAFVKARAGDGLSDLELHYLTLQNDATLSDWQQVYREVQEGVLEDSIIPVEAWRRVFRTQPNLSQRWAEIGHEYEPSFVRFISDPIVPERP
ncbi:MAG: hypothetical protein R3284_09500, partial [Rubricoccaceae bacterium]|nr:hypothetical protein [Rubricoccaceae bacterium]